MSSKVPYTPAGYHTSTPYLTINDSAAAIEFYKKVFGATEIMRMPMPNGKMGHAEIQIGDSRIMMGDAAPEMGRRDPVSLGGTAMALNLYVEDCDAVVAKATALGAKVIWPLRDQFYGDRSATIIDPFGHQWTVATHKEDVSPAELKKRAEACFAQMANK
jgi:PhnB protein